MKSKVLAAAVFAVASGFAQNIAGIWDATVNVNGVEIPFAFELAGSATNPSGSFFNGDERVTSTSGTFAEDKLVLLYDHYAGRLEATLKDGELDGVYKRVKALYAFHAKPHVAPPAPATAPPPIGGLWEVGVKSSKGESAWRLIIRQSGADVSAAILRVDGDTGTLSGRWRDGKFLLSHFSGARPALLEITPAADGTLQVDLNRQQKLTATRQSEARAKGLPAPTDPTAHTRMKDPSEPLKFAFPDLKGMLVSSTDARFRGKVVLVNIGGSWCPNCHDEAPFLMELYRKYHGLGLEIVMLSFEEEDQQQDLKRLHAFVSRYGVEYPVLMAGAPSDLAAKLPQAVNLNAWPTTFFIGRDGLVRAVHAGFAGKASGELHQQLKEEMSGTIETLLAENSLTSR
jgi:thiol-disulfide isomerase/thioredoxin